MAVIIETTDAPSNTSTPYSIAIGDIFEGSLTGLGGTDYIAVDLIGGQHYAITMDRRGTERPLQDSFLTLYDALDDFVATDDDGGGDLNALMSFVAPSSGTFYIAASAYAGDSVGDYQITIATSAAEDTDLPADQTTPQTLTVGSNPLAGTMTGAIDSAGDVDWVAVDLLAGETYRFSLTGVTGAETPLFDPELTLYAADGTPIHSDDDGGPGLSAAFVRSVESDGTYYLGLAGHEDDETGQWQIGVEINSDQRLTDSADLSRSGSAMGLRGNDTLIGSASGDVIDGGAGRDRLIGNDGRDILRGGPHADVLRGGNGLDRLEGGGGNDRMFGGARGDYLIGNRGNDRLSGGPGADNLEGGPGNDILIGGIGADVFAFAPRGGADIIEDFTVGEDELHISALTGFLELNATELLERIARVEAGNTILDFKDGTSVTLLGIDDPTVLADSIA